LPNQAADSSIRAAGNWNTDFSLKPDRTDIFSGNSAEVFMLLPYRNIYPRTGEGCFIADSAQVIGDVTLGDHSSVWFGSVIRGDVNKIVIGHHTNIQDLCVVHVTRDLFSTTIGNYVTLGHSAIVHGCTVEDNSLIGIGAKVLDGAVIGRESIVAAGAVVPVKMIVPPRSLVAGIPATIKRQITDDDIAFINKHWRSYLDLKEDYLR
jgi:carbonic anhydrase/acetyltransferase-like protein (isoleucine patch superfamily)